MRKTKYVFICLTLFILLGFFTFSALGTVTQTSPDPTDDQTGVYVKVGAFTVLLNTSDEVGHMSGTISLYLSTNLVTSTTLTNVANSTQSLTLPTLDELTTYTVYVNVNDSVGWTNQSYNFTTAEARLTDNTNFDATDLLMIGVFFMIVLLGAMYYTYDKMIVKKEMETKQLMLMLFGLIVLVIGLITIASMY